MTIAHYTEIHRQIQYVHTCQIIFSEGLLTNRIYDFQPVYILLILLFCILLDQFSLISAHCIYMDEGRRNKSSLFIIFCCFIKAITITIVKLYLLSFIKYIYIYNIYMVITRIIYYFIQALYQNRFVFVVDDMVAFIVSPHNNSFSFTVSIKSLG